MCELKMLESKMQRNNAYSCNGNKIKGRKTVPPFSKKQWKEQGNDIKDLNVGDICMAGIQTVMKGFKLLFGKLLRYL